VDPAHGFIPGVEQRRDSRGRGESRPIEGFGGLRHNPFQRRQHLHQRVPLFGGGARGRAKLPVDQLKQGNQIGRLGEGVKDRLKFLQGVTKALEFLTGKKSRALFPSILTSLL
jgi:hypothetical protein